MQFFTGLNRIYSETGFMNEKTEEGENGLYSRDELENIIKKYGDSVYTYYNDGYRSLAGFPVFLRHCSGQCRNQRRGQGVSHCHRNIK